MIILPMLIQRVQWTGCCKNLMGG